MMRIRNLGSNQRGVSATEFGLLAPVFISFIIGTTQLGTLFFANADMRNAIAAGARAASVWPVPPEANVKAAVEAQLVRAGVAEATEVTVPARAVDSNGNPYMQISMSYDVPLNFLFFDTTVTLRDTRTVMLQRDFVAKTTTPPPTTTPTGPTTPPADDPPADDPPADDPPADDPPADDPPADDPPADDPPVDTGPGKGKGKDEDKHEDHGTCTKKCK
jgi:Flp pilus assembly protein TadG